jgi:hypothetical protein
MDQESAFENRQPPLRRQRPLRRSRKSVLELLENCLNLNPMATHYSTATLRHQSTRMALQTAAGAAHCLFIELATTMQLRGAAYANGSSSRAARGVADRQFD